MLLLCSLSYNLSLLILPSCLNMYGVMFGLTLTTKPLLLLSYIAALSWISSNSLKKLCTLKFQLLSILKGLKLTYFDFYGISR